jgi:hypothetical protein
LELPCPVRDVRANPELARVFAIVFIDGRVGLGSLNDASTVIDVRILPPSDLLPPHASCLSWSPKGKQVAIGMRTGQVVAVTTEGRCASVYSLSLDDEPLQVVHVLWVESATMLFAAEVDSICTLGVLSTKPDLRANIFEGCDFFTMEDARDYAIHSVFIPDL